MCVSPLLGFYSGFSAATFQGLVPPECADSGFSRSVIYRQVLAPQTSVCWLIGAGFNSNRNYPWLIARLNIIRRRFAPFCREDSPLAILIPRPEINPSEQYFIRVGFGNVEFPFF